MNTGIVDARSARASPLRGLRTVRAGRLQVVNVPKPAMRTFSPAAKASPIALNPVSTASAAADFPSPIRPATQSAISDLSIESLRQYGPASPGPGTQLAGTVHVPLDIPASGPAAMRRPLPGTSCRIAEGAPDAVHRFRRGLPGFRESRNRIDHDGHAWRWCGIRISLWCRTFASRVIGDHFTEEPELPAGPGLQRGAESGRSRMMRVPRTCGAGGATARAALIAGVRKACLKRTLRQSTGSPLQGRGRRRRRAAYGCSA